MVKVIIYRDSFSNTYDLYKGSYGKLKNSFPHIDYNNSLIFCNGRKIDEEYALKDNDTVTIRTFPSGVTAAIIGVAAVTAFAGTMISDVIVKSATGKNIGEHIKDGVKAWMGLTSDSSSNVDTTGTKGETESVPSLKGAKNSSQKGKPVPVTIGQSRFTPMIAGSTYTSIGGTDGEFQYMHTLYMLGYNDIAVGAIKLGEKDLATNGFKEIYNNGNYTVEVDESKMILNGTVDVDTKSSVFTDSNPQIEIQNENEVSLYPQKVVQENINSQLICTKDAEGNLQKLKFDRFSDSCPHIVEIEFYCESLISYDSNGNKKDASVEVAIGVSFDAGKNYEPFSQITGSNSYFPVSFDSKDVEAGMNGALGLSTITRAKNKNMRFVARRELTYEEAVKVMTEGQNVLNLRIEKRNEDSADGNTNNRIILAAIRTWTFDKEETKSQSKIVPQSPVEGRLRKKTTRLALKIKATENLGGQIDALNLMQISKCRTWDSESKTWSVNKSISTNPASNVLNIMQHKMLGSHVYSDDKIDLYALGELYEFCEQKEFSCGGVLTSRKKLSEIIDNILRGCRAVRTLNGNKYSVFIDKPCNYPVCVLNNHNILNTGISNEKEFRQLPDGYKIKFINKNIGYDEDEIYVMFNNNISFDDPEAVIESVDMPWITDVKQAWKNAWYEYAKVKLRPELWNRKVGPEGNLIEIGSLVEIQDDTISVGIGDGGYIREIKTEGDYITGFIIDSDIDIPDNTSRYGAKIISSGDYEPKTNTFELEVSEAGCSREFKFKNPVSVEEDAVCVDDLVSFGYFENETISAICLGKKGNGDGTFDITLVPYSEDVYTADETESVPEFNSKVSISEPTTGKQIEKETVSRTDLAEASSNILGGINSGSSSVIEFEEPNSVTLSSVIAYEDRIECEAEQNGNGLVNNIKKYVWEISRDGEAWDLIGETTGSRISYYFNRTSDGYPEASILSHWKIRVYGISVYNKYKTDAEGNTVWTERAVNTDSYGTWILEAPKVIARPGGRNITLMMSRNARADNKKEYGNITYRIRIKRYDDSEFYCPATSSDPYEDESNYKDESGTFISCSDTYSQTLPLENQSVDLPKDTGYAFEITAVNEAGSWASAIITAAALATSAKDIVANAITTNKLSDGCVSYEKLNSDIVTGEKGIFKTMVSAEAVLAKISGNAIHGTSNNIWDLETGEFKVGGDDEYINVVPVYSPYGTIENYEVTFKVGNFNISTSATEMKGDFYVVRNDKALDRANINPKGIYFEHRDNLNSPWLTVSSLSVSGARIPQVYSDGSLIISNKSIADRRKNRSDLGIKYPENALIYHYDTDFFDQYGNSSIELTYDDMPELKGVDDEAEKNTVVDDFTPAVMAVAPYSSTAKMLYGNYSLSNNFGISEKWSADFYLKFFWNDAGLLDAQTLFDFRSGTENLRLRLVDTEPFYNEPAEGEPFYNNETAQRSALIPYNEIKDSDCYIEYISVQGTKKYSLPKEFNFDFNVKIWYHISIIKSDGVYTVIIGNCDTGENIEINFDQVSKFINDVVLTINNSKKLMCIDELLVLNNEYLDKNLVKLNTVQRIPWGALSKDEKHFILDVENKMYISEEFKKEILDYVKANI